MSETKPSSEPTMEEILASIRRIISEDEPAEGEKKPEAEERPVIPDADATLSDALPPAVEEEVVEDDDDDILELTDALEEQPEPEPEPEPEAEPEFELAMEEPVYEPPPPTEPPRRTDRDGDLDRLVSDPTAGVAAAALSSLSHSVTQNRGVYIGAGHRTLEDLVKELLRPMLREWLDANLPPLVERLVQKEIARISGRADDD